MGWYFLYRVQSAFRTYKKQRENSAYLLRIAGYQDLRATLVKQVNAEVAILDETSGYGSPGAHRLCPYDAAPAFGSLLCLDLMWLNAEDLTQLPLLTRKKKLKR